MRPCAPTDSVAAPVRARTVEFRPRRRVCTEPTPARSGLRALLTLCASTVKDWRRSFWSAVLQHRFRFGWRDDFHVKRSRARKSAENLIQTRSLVCANNPGAQWTARPTDFLRLWADLARGHLSRRFSATGTLARLPTRQMTTAWTHEAMRPTIEVGMDIPRTLEQCVRN